MNHPISVFHHEKKNILTIKSKCDVREWSAKIDCSLAINASVHTYAGKWQEEKHDDDVILSGEKQLVRN